MARVLTSNADATALFRELALLQEPGALRRVAASEPHNRQLNTTKNNPNINSEARGASLDDALLVRKLLANPRFVNFFGALVQGNERNMKFAQDLAIGDGHNLQVQMAYLRGGRDTLMMFLTQPFKPDGDSKDVGFDQ